MIFRRVLIFVIVFSSGLAIWLLDAKKVLSLPYYAAKTEADCGSCHFDPGGGGPRNDMGFLFATQRNDFDDDPNPKWAGLEPTHQLGDVIYFGADINLLYAYSAPVGEGTDLSSFFQMQSGFYSTFHPITNLTFVLNLDWGEFSGSQTRDIYAMLQDDSERFYLKGGRLRQVYGLRQFDHTAGTRVGFLSAGSGGTGGFLPYDSRTTETGVELGVKDLSNFRVAAQLTNGGPAFANNAQTVSGLVVYQFPILQLGASAYDSYLTSRKTRATRWGGYGILRVPGIPRLFLLGEIGFGTDDAGDGTKQNLRASYAEGIYEVSRAIRVRAKYDFSDIHRSEEGNASERFSVEADYTPLPFSDFKLSYRRIVPERTKDENQVLVLWYVYY